MNDTNPFKILRDEGEAPYPLVHMTVAQYRPSLQKPRLGKYSICELVRGLDERCLMLLAAHKLIDDHYPRIDISSELILYSLLEGAGLPSEVACGLVYQFPDPHIFHPMHGVDPHGAAELLLSRSMQTNPVESLVYVARNTRPVMSGQKEYDLGVQRLAHRMQQYL